MNTEKEQKKLSWGILAMVHMKIVIKECDTNFKKPNEANHLYKSGFQCREQREIEQDTRSK